MSKIEQAIEDYLSVRRALGFKLHGAGYALRSFAGFLKEQGATLITTDLALRWACQPPDAKPATRAGRLSIIRGFARYHSATDPRTEVPPQYLLPYRSSRRIPYIFSETNIEHLISAARQLPSSRGLRPLTYATLFGLVAVTGMRISEPLGLDDNDVDLTEGVLTIRYTKFRKSRLVPIHTSTARVLQHYRTRRNRTFPHLQAPRFFISDRGTPPAYRTVHATFTALLHRIDLDEPNTSRKPSPHDLRHRFAVRTLLRWYRDGLDVECHLPELSTYLGHAHINDTYWYLSATPELLRLAAERLDGPVPGRLS